MSYFLYGVPPLLPLFVILHLLCSVPSDFSHLLFLYPLSPLLVPTSPFSILFLYPSPFSLYPLPHIFYTPLTSPIHYLQCLFHYLKSFFPFNNKLNTFHNCKTLKYLQAKFLTMKNPHSFWNISKKAPNQLRSSMLSVDVIKPQNYLCT